MAFFTVGGGHLSHVRFVALGALRDLAMYVMTLGTVKCGMLALVFPELLDLLGMAGEASVRNVGRKGNVQRRVRVLVATEAALEVEVRHPPMAGAALWDWLLDGRRVTDMTAGTSDLLVFLSGGSQISRRSRMTFHTIFV